MQNTSSESALEKETWWKTSPLPTLHLSGSGAQWTELSRWSFAKKRSTIYPASAWSKKSIKFQPVNFLPCPLTLGPTHLPCIWGVPVYQDQCCHLRSQHATVATSCKVYLEMLLSKINETTPPWPLLGGAAGHPCSLGHLQNRCPNPPGAWAELRGRDPCDKSMKNLFNFFSHLDMMSLQPLEPHVPVSNPFENVPSWNPWDQPLTQQPLVSDQALLLRWGFLQFHRGIWGTYSLLHHSCRRSLSRRHRSQGT